MSGNQFYYVPVVIRTLYDFLEANLKDSEEKIEFCLKKIWEFLVLMVMLDTNSKVDVSLRKKLIIQLKKINLESIDDWVNMSKGFKLKDEVGVPLPLLTSLKKILLAGYSLKDYESVITYFNLGNENNYYNLVPIQDISFKFNDIYYQ